MAALREWLTRIWRTLRPGRPDADLEAELRAHLEMAAEDARRKAASTEETRRAAVIRWGSLAQSMEPLRDQRGLPWLDDLRRDLRYGLRALRRYPMFTSVAVLTLALGIGANTAIFSLADAALIRTLPVRHPHDLVVLRQVGRAGDIFPFRSAAAADLALSRDALSGLAAFRPLLNAHVSVNGETELADTQLVSANYYAVLGVHAVVGRTLAEQDRDPVAVISYRYWRQRFAGDLTVIGRTLEMQGRTFTIVGVTPPGFFGTQPGRHIDVTAPLDPQTMTMRPNARWLYLIGRLAPGVTREPARAALRTRWVQLAGRSPQDPPVTLELDSGAQGLNELGRQFSRPLEILLAAVGLVLLVACANLTGLLIVRASTRQQEMAVRLSLGAARGRIVRQLLTESALLAVAGGAAGIALAYVATDLLLAMMSRGRAPIALDVALSARTLVFAATVTIVTAVLFGLLPALAASRADLQPTVKRTISGGDRTQTVWARGMVIAQVALLVLLLGSAGLFVRTLQKLRSVDPGFQQANVLVVNVSAGPAYRGPSARALYDDLYARFSALPGVQSISLTMDTPLGGEPSMSTAGISVLGRPPEPEDAPQVLHNLVGPRFFETMGIPILAGRDFGPGDDERASKSVIISESAARRYFGAENPLGFQIVFRETPASIVGIAKDVRYTSLRAETALVTYRPYRQEINGAANTFLIRTSATVDLLTSALRTAVRAAAPALPTPSVISLDDLVAAGLVEERMLAALSSAIAVLAALLAGIGIYSTVAAGVARRQLEIGVRMALGAVPGQVTWKVIGETCGIVALGLVIGVPAALAGALALRGVLAGVLFELSPADPRILSIAVGMILLIALLAAYVPARRASRIDPVAAIKYE